jgi:DNA topoisomerase VI subunit B
MTATLDVGRLRDHEAAGPRLERATFRTSRLLDFCSRKELIAQTGHEPAEWPLVALKELVDNTLDACEEAGVAPEVRVGVGPDFITVADNGPGIPPETVAGVLDFSVRVSSREAYVSPSRGAQGNALKTIVAMPFVLSGTEGGVTVTAQGVRHEITLRVDRIRQEPVIDHQTHAVTGTEGTTIRVSWPDSPWSKLADARARFLQIADDYTFLNPHLSLSVDWCGEATHTAATAPGWPKWGPRDPTCPHWYRPENLARLVAAYVAHDQDAGRDRTVREFIKEFRGLSGTAKQKAVLEATGLARSSLAALAAGGDIDAAAVGGLLDAMKAHSKKVKPADLGVVGKAHLARRLEALGCEMESFNYKLLKGETGELPWVIESAFAWCPSLKSRRLVTGVNWSPGIINPFRQLGTIGRSLDSVLQEQRAGQKEPVVLVLHMACPRVEYTDRGKSAVVVGTIDQGEE